MDAEKLEKVAEGVFGGELAYDVCRVRVVLRICEWPVTWPSSSNPGKDRRTRMGLAQYGPDRTFAAIICPDHVAKCLSRGIIHDCRFVSQTSVSTPGLRS